jgi:hypothetical protein
MVMVIDDAALRVVSSLVGMYDVMEHRVTLIELLKRERQPLPVRTQKDIQHLCTPTCNTAGGLDHSSLSAATAKLVCYR